MLLPGCDVTFLPADVLGVCVRACMLRVAVSSKQEWRESAENPGVINSPDGLGLISAPAMVLLPRGPYLKLEAGIKVALS